jgi:transketolase
VLNPELKESELVLIASGSEVPLIAAAGDLLAAQGVKARLVSMPSWELFRAQPEAYRESVLPASAKRRLAVEAGVSLGWHAWVGDQGALLTLDRYGASAPAGRLLKEFGFTPEKVVEKAQALLQK